MPQILELLLAGLLVFFGSFGTSSTAEVAPNSGAIAPQPADEGSTTVAPPIEIFGILVSDGLLDLLAYVPDTPENRKWLTLGDPQAWHEATGVPRINNMEEARALTEEEWEAWVYSLPAETMPPNALGLQYLVTEDLRDIVGFSYFEALQYVDAGAPPGNLAIVTVDVPHAEIVAALEASGYEALPADNFVTIFAKGEDYALDLSNPSRLASLGQLNRIGVLANQAEDAPTTTVLIGRGTETVADSANALLAENSLLRDPYYAALRSQILADSESALEANPGELVGTMFLGEMPVGDAALLLTQSPEEAKAAIEAQIAWLGANPFDPWMATALTTHRGGDDLYLSAYVAFPPGVDAFANAESLAARMASYVSTVTGHEYSEYWEHYATDWAEVDGVPIARVTMHVLPEYAGTFNWSRMILQRDDQFLVPAAAP